MINYEFKKKNDHWVVVAKGVLGTDSETTLAIIPTHFRNAKTIAMHIANSLNTNKKTKVVPEI